MGTTNRVFKQSDPEELSTEEEIASGAVTPGDLVERGGSNDIRRHANAGQNARPLFAKRMRALGHDHEMDEDYQAGDTVPYGEAEEGDVIHGFLADGENVTKGDFLESAGNGALQAHTPPAIDEGGTSTQTIYTSAIVAEANEDLNNTSGSKSRIELKVTSG